MTTSRRDLLQAVFFAVAIPAFSGLLSTTASCQEMWLRGEPVDELESIDSFIRGFVRQNRLRGAGVVIVKKNKLVYARSMGYVLTSEAKLLEADTLVPVGSVTKFLTALAVMKLVEDGRVELDAPFLNYIPASLTNGLSLGDHRWKTITIRHLLQMCAGIPDMLTAMWKFRSQLKSRKDAYRMMLSSTLQYAPGQEQRYNNCNFSILGDIIAATTGKFWLEYVAEAILRPVGIDGLPSFDKIGLQGSSPDFDWNTSSEGAACMSLMNLARLIREFSREPSTVPLKLETRLLMLQPPKPPLRRNEDGSVQMGYYGLGLMEVGWDERGSTFAHGGSLPNAHTFFIRQPDGSIFTGYYCGELPSDPSGSGQWRMSEQLLNAANRIAVWPAGEDF